MARRGETNAYDMAGQSVESTAIVSALTCNLINSLEDLTGDRIRVETASGMTVIEWEDLSDGGKLLIDSWFLGLQCLARNTIAYSLSK